MTITEIKEVINEITELKNKVAGRLDVHIHLERAKEVLIELLKQKLYEQSMKEK